MLKQFSEGGGVDLFCFMIGFDVLLIEWKMFGL